MSDLSDFTFAATKGSKEQVQTFVTSHPELIKDNTAGTEARTVLAEAVNADKGENVSVLLSVPQGLEALKIPDNRGYLPIHYAVQGRPSALNALLDVKSDEAKAVLKETLKTRNEPSFTPSMTALYSGHGDVVAKLEEKGAPAITEYDINVMAQRAYKKIDSLKDKSDTASLDQAKWLQETAERVKAYAKDKHIAAPENLEAAEKYLAKAAEPKVVTGDKQQPEETKKDEAKKEDAKPVTPPSPPAAQAKVTVLKKRHIEHKHQDTKNHDAKAVVEVSHVMDKNEWAKIADTLTHPKRALQHTFGYEAKDHDNVYDAVKPTALTSKAHKKEIPATSKTDHKEVAKKNMGDKIADTLAHPKRALQHLVGYEANDHDVVTPKEVPNMKPANFVKR